MPLDDSTYFTSPQRDPRLVNLEKARDFFSRRRSWKRGSPSNGRQCIMGIFAALMETDDWCGKLTPYARAMGFPNVTDAFKWNDRPNMKFFGRRRVLSRINRGIGALSAEIK